VFISSFHEAKIDGDLYAYAIGAINIANILSLPALG
jgi:hypothetical protein